MSLAPPRQPHHVTFAIETSGLAAWHGDRVICICAVDSRGDAYHASQPDEHQIIMGFIGWLLAHKAEDFFLLTRNGKIFHVPFLCARIEMDPELSEAERKELTNRLLAYDHMDLQEVQKGKGPRRELPDILNRTPDSGSRRYAYRLWKKGHYEKLIKYAMKAVTSTQEAFLAQRK